MQAALFPILGFSLSLSLSLSRRWVLSFARPHAFALGSLPVARQAPPWFWMGAGAARSVLAGWESPATTSMCVIRARVLSVITALLLRGGEEEEAPAIVSRPIILSRNP